MKRWIFWRRQRDQRTDKDYAIEFGGYLADAAVFLMDVINMQDEEDDHPDPDLLNDAWRGLSSAIYEFRKRAARVATAR